MLLQCTKKLLDELKIKPETEPSGEPLFSWHGNVMMVNRKKTVVIVNDQSLYPIVLHGLKAKDFKKLDELIIEAIRETFHREGIKDELIQKYLEHAENFTYAKTKDRTSVARMNKQCENVEYFGDYLNEDSIFHSGMSLKIGKMLAGQGKNNYIYPNQELYKSLEAFYGEAIFDSQAAVLKVNLHLGETQSWRRLVVPLHMNFFELHETLQAAFGWSDSHLHMFYIDDETGHKLSLVEDPSVFEFQPSVPMKHEGDFKITDILPAKIKYIYDFGDNWEHDIEVEEIIDDFDKNHPVCLDGEGNTPPEDVGGAAGYEEFLRILEDDQHPDHEEMKSWGKSNGYGEFNVDLVNIRLN